MGCAVSLSIEYESDGFPAGARVANGWASLSTSWDDLLWAAITVGRPNRNYVFRHGDASAYEALFRLSLVRMALEQSGTRGSRFRRTQAARTLDPSEKGAVNYFLGLATGKLFADKLLGAPWMLHLDVFRPVLNPVLSGRSRPDLVGQNAAGQWVALECKGRITPPNVDTKTKAKLQAERVLSINGVAPILHIGAITYFFSETMQFFWQDPEPSDGVRNAIRVSVEPDSWRYYYAPILELLRRSPEFPEMQKREVLAYFAEVDLRLGIHPSVLRPLRESNWEEARKTARAISREGRYRADGIAVHAGEKWLSRFEEELG